MKKIRMVRNVLVEGQHCAVGEVIEVDDALATRLIQWRRAEAVGEELPDPSEGEGTEPKTDEADALGGQESAEVETATRPEGKRRGAG